MALCAGVSFAAPPAPATASPPAASSAVPSPAAASGRTWVVSAQGTALSLDDALRQAGDGDVIELLPGTYTGAWRVPPRRLVLRGMPGETPVVLRGPDKPMAAKALLQVMGGEVTLQNLEFRGARGLDGSAAGVRQEAGVLRVLGCRFFDNEHGITTANDEQAELHIEASVIGQAPRIAGTLPHLLNVGRIGRFVLTGSRLQQGFEGHMVKSRARESHLGYNFIHDGRRGGASYEIEFPHGGRATVIGNVLGQGADTQNPVVLAYGTEPGPWTQHELVVAHNTFVHYGWLPAWFVRVFDDTLGTAPRVLAVNNLLVGPGVFAPGVTGRFEGNRRAVLGMLRDADTYAFELAPGSLWRGAGIDPARVDGRDLAPRAEFAWPIGTQPLAPGRSSWTPGAFQK